jgi:site-specific recombinase XerD
VAPISRQGLLVIPNRSFAAAISAKLSGTAGLTKRGTGHNFRHSFAAHLLEGGCNIRPVQELPGFGAVRGVVFLDG